VAITYQKDFFKRRNKEKRTFDQRNDQSEEKTTTEACLADFAEGWNGCVKRLTHDSSIKDHKQRKLL
jgi:hypothetical protein